MVYRNPDRNCPDTANENEEPSAGGRRARLFRLLLLVVVVFLYSPDVSHSSNVDSGAQVPLRTRPATVYGPVPRNRLVPRKPTRRWEEWVSVEGGKELIKEVFNGGRDTGLEAKKTHRVLSANAFCLC